MADDPATFGPADLRAAVAAGLVTEAQAAGITSLANDRLGRRALLPTEDEPFEFFRGFAEIFIAAGLSILLGGIALLLGVVGGEAILIAIPAIIAASTWWMARYFTLNRRMNLPSMVLVTAFSGSIYISALTLLFEMSMRSTTGVVGAALIATVATAIWFWRFRLPFAMFILGIFALIAISGLFSRYNPVIHESELDNWLQFFVPTGGQMLASLLFGVGAFIGAMWFDIRDPHRIGRHSATAFWLHLLAGGALVNTIAGNLYAGGTGNLAVMALALSGFALIALIIDRRSMLTAGMIYIGALVYWAIAGDGSASARDWAVLLIILGALFTVLGTWWVQLRGVLMRALPAFPGKDRLAPYSETP